ncbi:hypothetical protein BC629DRAFT_1540585 [Irpex lacteus]|nr:hypothetical protein BC629DRAFT_1540585 [Irpex lacteus]
MQAQIPCSQLVLNSMNTDAFSVLPRTFIAPHARDDEHLGSFCYSSSHKLERHSRLPGGLSPPMGPLEGAALDLRVSTSYHIQPHHVRPTAQAPSMDLLVILVIVRPCRRRPARSGLRKVAVDIATEADVGRRVPQSRTPTVSWTVCQISAVQEAVNVSSIERQVFLSPLELSLMYILRASLSMK